MITVYDFINMCIEPSSLKVTLFDDAGDYEKLAEGFLDDDAIEKYHDWIVDSYDLPEHNSLTLNICEG